MGATLDSFVAGPYYTFFSQPNVDNINFPRYVSVAGNTILDTGLGGVPSWVGATSGGFELITVMHGEPVRGDIWGSSTVETIYRGADVFLQWDSISFRPGSVQTMWPWGILGNMGTLGRLGSVTGGTLFMAAAPATTTSGTPLIGQVIINALTARNAILAEGVNQSMLFDSRLRKVSVRMRLLPFLSATYTLNSTASINAVNYTASLGPLYNNAGAPNIPAAAASTFPSSPITNMPSIITSAAASAQNTVAGSNVSLITQGLQGTGQTTRSNPYTTFPLYSWYTII